MNDEENIYDAVRRFEKTAVIQVIESEMQLRETMRDFVMLSDEVTALARRALDKKASMMWPDLPVRLKRIEEISEYLRYRYLPFVRRVPWWLRLLRPRFLLASTVLGCYVPVDDREQTGAS
jgi:hypothetical protein